MIDYYNNESRLTEILRAVVNSSTIDLGPARTREEIFVSRAFGLTMWPAIPPRTTLEMWLAFIAGDTAEPAAGTYTVRTCAESCIITYARRVRGASAVVPIFVPHTHYERALAKLAGIVPLNWGVLGREWEHLLQILTSSTMPRSAVTVIGGELAGIGPGGAPSSVAYGTNLLDLSAFAARATARRCRLRVNQDNTLTVTCTESGQVWAGTAQAVGGNLVDEYTIPVNGGETIVVSASFAGSFAVVEADAEKTVTRFRTITGYITLQEGTRFIGLRFIVGDMTVGDSITTTFQVQRALNCADYLGVGVWRLSGGAAIIHAQIHTEAKTNHYDIAANSEDWSFTITVDGTPAAGGTTAAGGSGIISVAAGDHDVVIVATPGEGAGVCIIQPTLYFTATAGLLGAQDQEEEEPAELEEPVEPEEPEEPVEPEEPAELEEPVEPEEPEEPVEPAEPEEPEEPVEPAEPEEPEEPVEPAEPEEPVEPAEPEEPEEPVEPAEPEEPEEPVEPAEPEEPRTTKRRRTK